MKLLVATRSRGKQEEARRLFHDSGIEIVFPEEAGMPATSAEDRLELAETFAANARAKAEYFSRQTGLPTIAEDSGLEVFALGGDPGVKSKRWAGAEGTEAQVSAANNTYLLKRLQGAPEAKRRARYRSAVVLYRTPKSFPETFEGACTGRILDAPAGTGGFGYDPLFYSDDLNKSFGEATAEEKDTVSHRGRAFRELLDHLLPREPNA